MAMAASLYDLLGVDTDADAAAVRSAYRGRIRALHPDSCGSSTPDHHLLTSLNRAWRVLGNPIRRADYDASLRAEAAASSNPHLVVVPPPPAPVSARSRREAWVLGVRAQIVRLSHQAGKSATQTLLLRNSRATRGDYAVVVDQLVAMIASDTEARVRAARAAGAAPLDLGVAATLLGIRAAADELRRASSEGIETGHLIGAELLDRMWDVLAHELTVGLHRALGGNPDLTRKLLRRAG